MKEPIVFIFNPAAGRLRRDPKLVDRAVTALGAAGLAVTPRATAAPGDATRFAREAAEKHAQLVIVCGGDGTINEAAQDLVHTQTALAVWPGGTANVLAAELGLPRSPQTLAELIAGNQCRVISVGRAFNEKTGWQRYFLLMAGIGVDAEIVRNVRPGWKRCSGYGAFWASGISFLARLPLTPFTVNLDERSYNATFACIANARGYGGGFRIAPRADISANELDVCILDASTRRGLLAHAALGLTGRHLRSRNVVYGKTQSVSGNSNPNTPVQIDGEYVGTLPMRFECIPNAIRVVCART
ncbi:MAG: diacylglycerol kinase family lipid kinase [Acidobacteria bacterium]|nr:diacylglycerol kinase family lipid kinase [Acidobacteriota bacterium]